MTHVVAKVRRVPVFDADNHIPNYNRCKMSIVSSKPDVLGISRLQIALLVGYETSVKRDRDPNATEVDDDAPREPTDPSEQIVVDSGSDEDSDDGSDSSSFGINTSNPIPFFSADVPSISSFETFMAAGVRTKGRAILRATNNGFFFARAIGGRYNAALENETKSTIRTLTNNVGNKDEGVNCGSFNCSTLIYGPFYPELWRLLKFFTEMDPLPIGDEFPFVRVRYPAASENKLSKNDDKKNRLDELTISCKLALMGLSPSVIAAVPMKFELGQSTYHRHLYVFERGYSALDVWLNVDVKQKDVPQRQADGRVLLKMMTKLSDSGIVLFDSKPSNMVVRDVVGEDLTIRFIDFDHSYLARFTNPNKETRDCLFLVNGVLLISASINKRYEMPSTSFHFFEALLEEMELVQFQRMVKAHDQYDKTLNEGKDWPPPDEESVRGMLCRVFDSYRRNGSTVRDYLHGQFDYTNSGETVIETDMSSVISSREIRLANHVLERLQHYGDFLKKPGQDPETPKHRLFETIRDKLEVLSPTLTFFDVFVKTVVAMNVRPHPSA